jgi:hypothetical protein
MSEEYNNRLPPPGPHYRQTNTRRDWGRQNNSYPQNTRFYLQENRPYDHSPQGNPRWGEEDSLPQPSTPSHTQADNSVGGADLMKVNIPKTKKKPQKLRSLLAGLRMKVFKPYIQLLFLPLLTVHKQTK